ncbi:MAG: hypothetical protein U9N42_03640 [Campylobacterota bacterium]|nr:hypothetical protein [Campylobacterota bacterium]
MQYLILILIIALVIFAFKYEKKEAKLLKELEKKVPIVSANDISHYELIKELNSSSLDEDAAKIEILEEALSLGATNLINFNMTTDTKLPSGQIMREPKGSFLSKKDNKVYYITHYSISATAVKGE